MMIIIKAISTPLVFGSVGRRGRSFIDLWGILYVEPQCRLPGVPLAHRCISSIHKVGFEVSTPQRLTLPWPCPLYDLGGLSRGVSGALSRLATKVCQNGPASRSSTTQPSRVGQDADISFRTKPARILANTSWRITSTQEPGPKRLTSRAKCVRLGSPATMSFALPAARLSRRVKRSAVK